MSITNPGASEPHDEDGSGTEQLSVDPGAGRVDQPWRALVALGEVIAAALLVVAGVRAWSRAIVTIDLPGLPESEQAITRLLGSWIALAVLAVTVAGLLVLDALRQGVLAWRVRSRRSTADAAPVPPGQA